MKDFVRDWRSKFGKWKGTVTAKELRHSDDYCACLQSVIQAAAQRALNTGSGQVFQPIHSCQYDDGTRMLSITGIVVNNNKASTVCSWYSKWDHANLDWSAPRRVDLPHLSLKERLHLERHLPIKSASSKSLARALGYRIDGSDSSSETKLGQYAMFAEYYPHFGKITI